MDVSPASAQITKSLFTRTTCHFSTEAHMATSHYLLSGKNINKIIELHVDTNLNIKSLNYLWRILLALDKSVGSIISVSGSSHSKNSIFASEHDV